MRVIFEPENNVISQDVNIGIGLGNFDGVHIGHQSLITKLTDECKTRNLYSLAYTFIKHPKNILRKKLITYQITTVKKKIELFQSFNLDYLYLAVFNEDFSRIQPEEFVKRILVDLFRVKLIVIGYNYTFGFQGSGDVTFLQELGKKYSFEVIVLTPVYMIDTVVSSTLIRKTLVHGNVEHAHKFLGRPYSIQGLVVRGRNLGEKIGFPTANILPENYIILPKSGVYLSQILIKGKLYKSITNVGNNPTFNLDKIIIETHILDFNENIYGEEVEVFFYKKLRDEKKFDGIESLVKQIKADVLVARNSEISHRESMLRLKESLIAVEADRLAGKKGFSIEDVDEMMKKYT